MTKIHKFLLAGTVALLIAIMTACSSEDRTDASGEVEHLYWKDIDAVVTDIDYRHWYASGHHYTADVTVKSEEYNLQKTFHLTNSDAKRMEGVKVGDTITVEMDSWVIDSTGEVTKRDFNSIVE